MLVYRTDGITFARFSQALKIKRKGFWELERQLRWLIRGNVGFTKHTVVGITLARFSRALKASKEDCNSGKDHYIRWLIKERLVLRKRTV